MEIVFCILGIGIAFASGLMIHASIVDDSFPILVGFMFLIAATVISFSSIDVAVKTSDYTVEALNGTLQYDTVSLNKDGKLLEIKIK